MSVSLEDFEILLYTFLFRVICPFGGLYQKTRLEEKKISRVYTGISLENIV